MLREHKISCNSKWKKTVLFEKKLEWTDQLKMQQIEWNPN